MPKRYPQDQRERAVRMVLDHLGEYDSVFAACSAIGPKLNIGRESLRRWVLQAQIDADERPGVTSAEQARISMPAQRKYPVRLRERATRMAVDARKDPSARTGACRRIGEQLG
jgi:transposase-like protein